MFEVDGIAEVFGGADRSAAWELVPDADDGLTLAQRAARSNNSIRLGLQASRQEAAKADCG